MLAGRDFGQEGLGQLLGKPFLFINMLKYGKIEDVTHRFHRRSKQSNRHTINRIPLSWVSGGFAYRVPAQPSR